MSFLLFESINSRFQKSLFIIVSMFANLTFSAVYERLGIKKLITMGMILSSLAFLVYYQATSLIMFYIGAFIFGIGFTYTNMLTFTLLINSWFTEKKGTIFGLISAGTGFGGSVMSPIMGYIITSYGFKESYLLTSIILFVLIIPIVVVTKLNPESELRDIRPGGIDFNKKPLKLLLKEKSIFLCLGIIFIGGLVMAPWIHIIPSHLVDRGFDELFASQILGVILFIMGLSKIIIGAIHDKAGIKVSLGICLTFFAISMPLLLIVSNKIMAWVFAIFFGPSLSLLSVMIPLFISAMAGEEYLGDIMGIAQALIVGGVALGTPLINFIYDLLGTNNLSLIIATILGILNILLTIYAFKSGNSSPRLIEGGEIL